MKHRVENKTKVDERLKLSLNNVFSSFMKSGSM